MDLTSWAEIDRLLGRATLRLRLQRAFRGGLLALAPALVGLGAAMVAIWAGWLDPGFFPFLLQVAGTFVPICALLGAFLPVDRLRLAYRLDRANDNADRLGSALEFSRLGLRRTPLMELQIADAVRHLPQVDPARALPWRLPAGARPALLACLLVAAASLLEPAPTSRPLPPPPPPPEEELLRTADLEAQREVARQLRQEAQRLQDPQLAQLASDFDELLERMAGRQIDREEALQRLEALQAAALIPPPLDRQAEELTTELAAIGQELKQEKVKEVEQLADALQRKDLGRSREELARLARLLASDKVPPGLLERLGKAFASLARKLASKLDSRDVEALRKEIGLLRQKMASRGLGAGEEQRLQELEQSLQQAVKRGGGQGPGPAAEPGQRAVNELHRRLDEAARGLADAARDAKQARTPPQQQAAESTRKQAGEKLQQSAEALERLDQARQQAAARQAAGQKLQQAREQMQRSAPGAAQSTAQAQRLEDFDSRAGTTRRGKTRAGQPAPTEGQGTSPPLGERGPRADSRLPGGTEARPAGGDAEQPPEQPPGKPPGQDGRQPQQLGRRGEGRTPADGQQAGTGHDPELLGEESRREAGFQEQQLLGKRGAGQSRSEIIQAAADRGFARVGYRDVYASYSGTAEEELARVRVPAGYRFFVRRYFELIRPRQGPEQGED
ncbi:MAG: hypothetical protein RBU45_23000 [Myxococcota bacterium]|nr:hypothetical protein [Myxococcota bacterium]